ncbi:MAG: tetratricopeptide repeat protein, partial [Caldilineae bacterium]
PSPADRAQTLTAWLADLTRRAPLVLFTDDAHLLDLNSIGLLNELLRAGDRFRVLFVTAFRHAEVEATSPLWHTLEEGISHRLALAPLNRAQTADLLNLLLHPTIPSADFVTLCFHNSGGNVFDLLEFLRYLIAKGELTRSGNRWLEPPNPDALSIPPRQSARLLDRLARLAPEARTLAEAATVLGGALELDGWQAVAAVEEDTLFRAVDTLIEQQVVVKVNGGYQFAHDKISDALYESLPPAQKRKLHRRAAQFLEARLEGDDSPLLPLVARHYVAAGVSDKAIAFSLRAARAAEANGAEWDAFHHYRDAARLLEAAPPSPDRDARLLEIYPKAAQFSSAAWIDAATCLRWLQKAIDHHASLGNTDAVFNLSLSYIVTSAITGQYRAARRKIEDLIRDARIEPNTLPWAILYGAGVCLVDWYQGHQQACFDHAVAALNLFEAQLDTLPAEAWPAYSWAIFWRDKARAYLGLPIEMANIEYNRRLMEEGKSDPTIYWHTLTAVGARAAFTGRWDDLLAWKEEAARRSRAMGKIYWFECWISHSYLYGALHHGEFAQVESHLRRVQASPDPYQVRLAYLFRGRYHLFRSEYEAAEENLRRFMELEADDPDNSYPEGLLSLAQTHLARGEMSLAEERTAEGETLAAGGPYANPLYRLQFGHLRARLAMAHDEFDRAETSLQHSLQLARTLDNPLQTAFTHRLWGELLARQHRPDDARRHFNRARDLFLSLGNKYQAAKVTALLEKLGPPAGEPA